MITNFENITFELTDYEKENVLPLIIRGLKTKVGKDNAISNQKIVDALKNRGINTSQPRVRKIIQYIRLTGIIERVIATSKGYYISNDEKELNDYIESLMQRASQIELLAKQIEYQKQKLIKN